MSTLVVITGASRGIGRALAEAAPQDAHVVDVSRSGGVPGVEHLRADLSDPASWTTVGDRVDELAGAEVWGRIVFVHAAGVIEPIGWAGEVDDDAYRRSVLVNSAAGQVLGHRFLKAVAGLEARRQLCWITSGAATNPYPGWSHYNAAKAACDHWVRTVGAEQAQRGGVEVCAVAPGVVATAMQERIRATSEDDFPRVQRFHDLHERGQLRDPGEVAEALWRALDRGSRPGAVLDLRG